MRGEASRTDRFGSKREREKPNEDPNHSKASGFLRHLTESHPRKGTRAICFCKCAMEFPRGYVTTVSRSGSRLV